MSDLANSLRQLSLGQYYDCFAEHGFEDWESLQCVTEEDFDLLGVKLGHRRILQREIAREQTLYGDHLRSSQSQSENEAWGRADSSKDYSLSSNRVKRRYRRHPKPDENAPRRPYSAYAMFSNKVREDLKDQNLSFVELARNAGERWKKLSPADKEPWISSASKAKRTYDTQLAKYRQTEEYSIYSAYLADFRSKHSKQETEDDQTSGQEPANQDRLKQDQPSQSQPSTDPAGIIPQEAENPDETDHEDEADRQESMIFNVHDLIGQESERSSFSTLEHRNFLARADFDTSQADNLRHIRVLNPFDHVTASDVRPYVDFFLDRINCVFHFFDGRELIDRFDSVFEVGRSMPNQIMSEICLVLALGVQISDGASEDKLIMWYENGRRYLDDENWRKKLWVMRLLLMISVYHVGDRQDTSHHYLDVAISIGKANGFHLGQSETRQSPEKVRAKWFEVWHIAEFLDNWLGIPSPSGHFKNFRLASLDDDLCCAAPKVMKQLSAILRCVSNERKPKPLERYREFVEALQMWATSLPDHLQFGTFPPEPQALTLAHLSALTESEKAALLNLQTMRLGIIVVLTWPSLHDVMENPSKRDAKDDVDHEAAHTCLTAAYDLAQLCSAMFRARSFPPRDWLPLYFLFHASLVSVIGTLFHKREWEQTRSQSSSRYRHRALLAVEAALEVFRHCGTYTKTALWYWTVLSHIRRWIKENKLDDYLTELEDHLD